MHEETRAHYDRLATFDDEELAAGVAEIRRRYPGERVEFRDRFAFVLGAAS